MIALLLLALLAPEPLDPQFQPGRIPGVLERPFTPPFPLERAGISEDGKMIFAGRDNRSVRIVVETGLVTGPGEDKWVVWETLKPPKGSIYTTSQHAHRGTYRYEDGKRHQLYGMASPDGQRTFFWLGVGQAFGDYVYMAVLNWDRRGPRPNPITSLAVPFPARMRPIAGVLQDRNRVLYTLFIRYHGDFETTSLISYAFDGEKIWPSPATDEKNPFRWWLGRTQKGDREMLRIDWKNAREFKVLDEKTLEIVHMTTGRKQTVHLPRPFDAKASLWVSTFGVIILGERPFIKLVAEPGEDTMYELDYATGQLTPRGSWEVVGVSPNHTYALIRYPAGTPNRLVLARF
jgi:hypothetical protein